MNNQAPEWHGFTVGDRVEMLVETAGDSPWGEEVAHPPGTIGQIAAVIYYGAVQGWGVEVSIGEEAGDGERTIVNVFDDSDVQNEGLAEDGGLLWFKRAVND